MDQTFGNLILFSSDNKIIYIHCELKMAGIASDRNWYNSYCLASLVLWLSGDGSLKLSAVGLISIRGTQHALIHHEVFQILV